MFPLGKKQLVIIIGVIIDPALAVYLARISPISSLRARKFKKVQAKKLVKSNKSNFTKFDFDQNPFFGISKLVKNQFLNWEKV